MSESTAYNWQKLLARISLENETTRKRYKLSYDEQVAEDPSQVEPTFEAFLEGLPFVRVAEPATKDEVNRLEELAGCDLPPSLKSFYEVVGGFTGEFGAGRLSASFGAPQALIERFSPEAKPYEKLTGLGLHDLIQLSWSNDKSALKPEGGFEQAAIDVVNEYLCFGFFGDGFCEAYGYIIQTSPDKFGAYCWHQDDALPDPDALMGYRLDELLVKVFEVLDEELEKGDDGSFDIELLNEKLSGEEMGQV